MFGLNLHTFHEASMPCDSTPGVYVIYKSFAAGALKNSECRIGAWAAWAPETESRNVLKASFKAGAVVGVIAGYKRQTIFPLMLPSVAVSFGGDVWIRSTFIPHVKNASGGVSVSVELPF